MRLCSPFLFATTAFLLAAGLFCSADAYGQFNPRQTTAFAVGEIDEEHGHFTERFIPPGSGLVVEPVYYGEVFTNTRGGISTRRATQYEGLFNLAIAADPHKLGLPIPGKFVILGQNSHGRGLTQDFVGDAQVLSNIDTFDRIMQVGEYWWEGKLCDGAVRVRLGKQDVSTEFLVINMAEHFVQSSFGISPALGVPTFPHPSAAALVLADLSESLQLKVGVWDGIPDGRNWGFSGTGITFTIGEIQYDYAVADGQLPGAFQMGLGYLSAGEVNGEPSPQAWGYYIEWEQTVYRENPRAEDDQGLGFFLQYGAGHGDGTMEVEFPGYFGAGVVYHGLVPRRDQDVVGVGVARSKLTFGGTNRETAVEVFYQAQVRPHVYIQPDLQYIASPSGIHPDALVVGMRFEAAF